MARIQKLKENDTYKSEDVAFTHKEEVVIEEAAPAPMEERVIEEVTPAPKNVIETIVQLTSTPVKKEYHKPTIAVHEESLEAEPDEFEDEFDEYDDNDEFDSYNFEPEEDEPVEEIEEPIVEEPTPTPIMEEYYDAESIDNDSETYQFEDAEIILPVIEDQPKEEIIVEEKIEKVPLQNLENESYDREFEPKEPDTPIEIPFESNEPIVDDYPDDSMKQMMEKLVQLETNNQIPSEFISSNTTFERQMLPMPSNDPASFMSPVPAGPLMDIPLESPKDLPPLEANPYFRSRKMNFHMKPIILSVVSVALFIGVFISIFAILNAFK